MVAKLSSPRTMSAACLATAVPEPIAMPMSARFSAGASFTPSPVIATTCPCIRNESQQFSARAFGHFTLLAWHCLHIALLLSSATVPYMASRSRASRLTLHLADHGQVVMHACLYSLAQQHSGRAVFASRVEQGLPKGRYGSYLYMAASEVEQGVSRGPPAA